MLLEFKVTDNSAHGVVFLLLVLVLGLWFCACGTEGMTGNEEDRVRAGPTRGTHDIAPGGSLVGITGCKQWKAAATGDAIPSTQDCVEYEYTDDGLLMIRHVNAGFNCCPEIKAFVNVRGDTVFVIEREISGLCDCICLFDLDYQIVGLEAGVYRVKVAEEYLEPEDEPLDFWIDLVSAPSGTYCVTRDHYPWGLQ
jgi:hypothetical protein